MDEIKKVRMTLQPVRSSRSVTKRQILGRPRMGAASKTGERQSLPLTPGQKTPTTTVTANTGIKRRTPFDFNIAEIDETVHDIELLYDWLPQVSSDVSLAVWLAVNLADSGWTLSIKNPVEGTITAEKSTAGAIDNVATAMAHKWLTRSGSYVHSNFPGACGNANTFIRSLLRDGALKGAQAAEIVFSADYSDAEFVQFDPMTVEFRHDIEHRGKFKFGQKQLGADKGWQELNPNITCYRSLDGTLYGDSPMAPALHTMPFFVRFLMDAQVFLHNSAWGSKSGEVDTARLEEMWKSLKQDERTTWKNDFLSWALDIAGKFNTDIQEQGELDPDSTQVYLDLIKIKKEESPANNFPMEEYRSMLKKETVNAVKTPAALMNERGGGDKSFNAMQIGAYESFLCSLQNGVKEIIERLIMVGFAGIGYDKPVVVEFSFRPVQVADRLTESQAEQLEILNILKKRDENFISQNEAARLVTGTQALGPAPLSNGANPDGASAPDAEIMAQRKAAGMNKAGAASGPSFGGNKKGSGADPTKDKKVTQ
jgi:hypothetical protein